MNKLICVLLAVSLLVTVSCRQTNPVEQMVIERIEEMPNSPERFALIDWKQIALNQDELLYDFEAKGPFMPFIWLDNNQRNIPIQSFGLYTAIGDVRQHAHANSGEYHESIGVLGSILGATLNGIDKSNQNGWNFVRMSENYFNSSTGWNIVQNNTCPESGVLGGGYRRDFWYDVYPNMLFYAIGERYPEVEGVNYIMRSVAEQFFLADSVIMATKGNYKMREFDFGQMKVGRTDIMHQADAAAGFSYVLFGAYRKYGLEKYLKSALSAMNTLDCETENPFYEVIMPFAVYMGARFNAEYDQNYDIHKYMDWTFDGQSTVRPGWGVIVGQAGGYEMNGLCGNTKTDYAFAMNTFDLAWPLVAAVRYDQRLARSVGKWMINAVSNARYFYPQYVKAEHQALDKERAMEVSHQVIAYEGFRRKDKYQIGRLKDVEGVAIGDGPGWQPDNPQESMISVYGSAHVGIFGAIVRSTNVEKIIRINCRATDYFAEMSYPTYLYYNPYGMKKSVEITFDDEEEFNISEKYDVYDIVSRRFVAKGIQQRTPVTIPSDNAMVLVVVPSGTSLSKKDGKTYAGDIVIDFLD